MSLPASLKPEVRPVHIKECEHCGKAFEPHPRLGRRQRVCRKAACRKWRAARSKCQWRQANADYYADLDDRHRPGYGSAYRLDHPEAVERNRELTRERMRRRRALFATQDSITRCIDGIITYLATPGVFATQDSMDDRLKVAG